MSAAAVIAIRRKRLIRRFREAGATDPDHPVTLKQIGERPTRAFRQMLRRNIILTDDGKHYYMDLPAAEAFRNSRRLRALLLTLFFIGIYLLGILIHLIWKSMAS